MSPDTWAMWLWGGLMLVVWAAIIGTLVWMVVLPTDRRRTPRPDARGRAGRRDGDRVPA